MTALFLADLEAVFSWLLTTSWQASVLAMVVLVIQRAFGARLNPRWRYALWLLVVLRLVMPALPESTWSLFQFAPAPPATLSVSVSEPIFISAPPVPSQSVHAEIPEQARPFTLYSLLAVVWLAGAIGLLILTWIVNRRFAVQVARSPEIDDPELLKLFGEVKLELGIRRVIRLVENGHVQSPAIMGLFQPTLLLPADVREKFDASELRLIFLHELAHLKRGDVMVQALIALLQILHWFNPVLWFAFRRMRIDREPATDALVLSRAGEAEKERYGLMLIKLLEHFDQRHSLPTLVGILEDKDQFRRRFSLIAKFTRGAYGWSLLGVLTIAILAVVCLTKAKSVQDPRSKEFAQVPSANSQDFAGLKRDLLVAQEDADARRVLLKNVQALPDDKLIATLQGLGRSNVAVDALQKEIDNENTDIVGLMHDGFDPNHPRIVSMREEVKAKQQQLSELIGGIRQAMAIDLQMADSRVELLNKRLNDQISPPATFSPSAPSAPKEPTVNREAGLIQIGLKVLEVNDDVYLANKEKFDAAVEKADIGFLIHLEGVSFLSTPSVSTEAGVKANIEVVREMPYPTSFQSPSRSSQSGQTNAADGTLPTPRGFAKKDVGVSAEITPEIDTGNSPTHGKIILNGKFSVTNFDGFTKSNYVGNELPSFSTSESLFIEALDDKELKGVWVPGERVGVKSPAAGEPFDPNWEVKAPKVKKRLLLFVSAERVKD